MCWKHHVATVVISAANHIYLPISAKWQHNPVQLPAFLTCKLLVDLFAHLPRFWWQGDHFVARVGDWLLESILYIPLMVAGVVLQQPPTREAPDSHHLSTYETKSSSVTPVFCCSKNKFNISITWFKNQNLFIISYNRCLLTFALKP